MQSVTNDNFGPLVAYLVPGATVLLGFRSGVPVLDTWFAATPSEAPTIGGFLYLTLASLAVGMTVSAIRWVVVDHLHAATGLEAPTLDFSRLTNRVGGLSLLIEIHYRHYQYYANMLVATAIAYGAYRFSEGFAGTSGGLEAGVALLELIFYFASRDTLRKYYRRTEQLLAPGRGAPQNSSLPSTPGNTRSPRR